MEVLVHVTAPSSRQDDQRWLQQARAYSNFRCARRHQGLVGQVTDHGRAHGSVQSRVLFLDDTQLATTVLESQLSVTSNEPAVKRVKVCHSDVSNEEPLLYHESLDKQSVIALPITHAVAETADSHWSETNDVPDQLPSSYSLTDEQSDERAGSLVQPASLVRPTASSDRQTSSQLGPDPSTANDALRPVTALKSDVLGSAIPSVKPMDDLVSPEELSVPHAAVVQKHHLLPRALRPPPPETSSEPFATHVTPALQSLIDNSSLAKVYAPRTTIRALRASERGYWTFDTSSWTPDAQDDFWTFMARMMEAGTCGWNVWCACTATDPNTSMVASSSIGVVKVFCWGQVVQHVYLLLYVASKSRIRRVACRWLDADGLAVLEM